MSRRYIFLVTVYNGDSATCLVSADDPQQALNYVMANHAMFQRKDRSQPPTEIANWIKDQKVTEQYTFLDLDISHENYILSEVEFETNRGLTPYLYHRTSSYEKGGFDSQSCLFWASSFEQVHKEINRIDLELFGFNSHSLKYWDFSDDDQNNIAYYTWIETSRVSSRYIIMQIDLEKRIQWTA